MMRQYELVERVASYKKDPNEALLNKAYVYSMQKHGEQTRASGDPYFSHPLEVAAILTELHLDEETIAVALLHDTIEDTDATRREIDEIFGSRIGALVEGLTKLKRLDLVSQKAKQAENLRRLLLAISDDIRVLLVKLADRLHNMRTLDHMKPHKRKRIATETMEIYAPLAGRMGMQDLREELDELSFKYVNPEGHSAVTEHLKELAAKNQHLIDEISRSLLEELADENINAEIAGRQKKAYSVFRKMESKSLSFEQLSDIFGFRVIVDTVPDCYRTLGIIHTKWKMVPNRFKDFISTPKQNDYQSIHTTVIGPSRQRVELQIRTQEMHEVAVYGVAAHSLYKEGQSTDDVLAENKAYASLRKTIEHLAKGDNPEEFLENTKLELFLDQVFCFTPKGQIIALPKGATPIDFAYAVHTDIGDSCVGCKLNGKIMPVITELQNGDEVDIIRSDSQSPPSAWESVAVTGKARSAIRRATRQAVNKQYAGLGKRLLQRAYVKARQDWSEEQIESCLPRLARKSVDDVFADVGKGEMSIGDVLRAVFPDIEIDAVTSATDPVKDQGWLSTAGKVFRFPGSRGKDKPIRNTGTRIPIRGLDGDLPVRFSKHGGAVPGDKIVGILEPGEGITIYPIQSTKLEQFDKEPSRWVDVKWDTEELEGDRFPARIKILASNVPGTLATITEVIANTEGNIQNISMQMPAEGFSEFEIDVEVFNLEHLQRVIRQLSKKSVTSKVVRLTG